MLTELHVGDAGQILELPARRYHQLVVRPVVGAGGGGDLRARWGPHAPTQGGHRCGGENGLFLETVIQPPSRAPNCNPKVVRSVSRETLQLWSIRPARRRSFFGLENGHLRHQIIKKIRCAALMKAAPYRARGNLY